MPNGHSIESFVRAVLLGDLRRMTYECGLHYLAFGSIGVGIEFLGACQDEEEFGVERKSGPRFERGIEDFMRPVNILYSEYNQPGSPFYLYKNLRCGMAHIMRPQGPIAFACRQNAQRAGWRHLEVIENSTMIMTAEDFYDDFAKACELLLAELPRKTSGKFRDVYLPVWEMPRKAPNRPDETGGISPEAILQLDTSHQVQVSGSTAASGCAVNYRRFRRT